MITGDSQPKEFPLSQVHPKAKIGKDVQIGPFCTIAANVEIGDGTILESNVSIQDGVRIGKKCRIMPGTTISADSSQLEYWNPEKEKSSLKPRVQIQDEVHIEPNATLHGGISIGKGSWIGSGATIHDGARIGKHCKIFPGAVVSAIPQDLKFHGEKTLLELGDHSVVRECATLNRGTDDRGTTKIGKHVLIMAYVHVAHDCVIGDHCIIANAVNIAGHVKIGDHVVIGGVSAVHQFVNVGKHAMISGGSLVRKDVPPYVKAGREPLRYEGVNSIGLRRRGFDNESINEIQETYRQIFLSGKNYGSALEYVEAHLNASEERDEIISFIRNAPRGIIKSGFQADEISKKDKQ